MYGIEINEKVNMTSPMSTTITARGTSHVFMADAP
jgi:hypothetical protein